MPSKTNQLLDRLKKEPVKGQEAKQLLGHSQYNRLLEIGAIQKFTDINPDYAKGSRGQNAMCVWIELGSTTHRAREWMSASEARDAGIRAAIDLLTAAGYEMIPPKQ